MNAWDSGVRGKVALTSTVLTILLFALNFPGTSIGHAAFMRMLQVECLRE